MFQSKPSPPNYPSLSLSLSPSSPAARQLVPRSPAVCQDRDSRRRATRDVIHPPASKLRAPWSTSSLCACAAVHCGSTRGLVEPPRDQGRPESHRGRYPPSRRPRCPWASRTRTKLPLGQAPGILHSAHRVVPGTTTLFRAIFVQAAEVPVYILAASASLIGRQAALGHFILFQWLALALAAPGHRARVHRTQKVGGWVDPALRRRGRLSASALSSTHLRRLITCPFPRLFVIFSLLISISLVPFSLHSDFLLMYQARGARCYLCNWQSKISNLIRFKITRSSVSVLDSFFFHGSFRSTVQWGMWVDLLGLRIGLTGREIMSFFL